jgi:hypothetical protein
LAEQALGDLGGDALPVRSRDALTGLGLEPIPKHDAVARLEPFRSQVQERVRDPGVDQRERPYLRSSSADSNDAPPITIPPSAATTPIIVSLRIIEPSLCQPGSPRRRTVRPARRRETPGWVDCPASADASHRAIDLGSTHDGAENRIRRLEMSAFVAAAPGSSGGKPSPAPATRNPANAHARSCTTPTRFLEGS